MGTTRKQTVSLAALSATEALDGLRGGTISSEALVRDCLARIEDCEAEVQAWAFLDPEYALDQARKLDALREAGGPVGPLHGMPVGLKDIIDTKDLPTECGTPIMAGRRPTRDATLVALLHQAGAVILGKTVSTEFAVYTPGKTRNPHDATRTPGGSSSGSAAAVAAGMVPLAVGTQTNGSVIRPASFCGIYGYKPTHGLISREGVLRQSRLLDTIGVFGRTVEDLAHLAEPLMHFDAADPDMRPVSRLHLVETALQEPPLTPGLAFIKSPVWQHADGDTQEAFSELADLLGENCDEVPLPEPFEHAIGWHGSILNADLARNLHGHYEKGRDKFSPRLAEMIEEGRRCLAIDYNQAVDRREILTAGLDRIFERFDAILTPAAPGEAPVGLDSTGSPIFCTLWTYCGLPAVTLPIFRGANGMPIGAQLVGRRGDDGRLLRTARWLAGQVQADLETELSRAQG